MKKHLGVCQNLGSIIRGTFWEGPRNKDYRILEVYIEGVPLTREITTWKKVPSMANYMVSLQGLHASLDSPLW